MSQDIMHLVVCAPDDDEQEQDDSTPAICGARFGYFLPVDLYGTVDERICKRCETRLVKNETTMH